MRTLGLALALALVMGVLSSTPLWAQPVTGEFADFPGCLKRLRAEAVEQGVPGGAFDRFMIGVEPDAEVLALLDRQPEFTTPIWDYLAGLVDEERVSEGVAKMAQWREVLARVASTYDVDPATVVAIWGVESNYGQTFGTRPLVRSLATLSCYGRRQGFFRGEFLTTLRILQEGHVAPGELNGSWAGAFGHTQFMPSTFMRIAVDFDGDGLRDLVGSVPDALASTAHYLRRSNWRNGEPWGFEVRLPEGMDVSGAGRRNKQPLATWRARGVTRADGAPLPEGPPAGLLLPAGAQGPAFLVFRNFDALYSYNAAESYALAIAHLSDRLRGAPAGFVTSWPTDDPGLSRAERREVQTRLLMQGYDIGEVDGMIGSRTREAVRAFMQAQGEASDGRAGRRVLERLRAAGASAGRQQ